jgi:hypothetical protein
VLSQRKKAEGSIRWTDESERRTGGGKKERKKEVLGGRLLLGIVCVVLLKLKAIT